VTEQSEGGDKSSKASEEQLERATGELRDLQRELVEVTKERDESKALVQELEEKNASLPQENHQTEESEDLKSQILANKITVQQNKKLNELLQKKVERLTASEVSLKLELVEAKEDKESRELLDKKVESLTASEASLQKSLNSKLVEAQSDNESRELLYKQVESLTASEVSLKKELEEAQESLKLKELVCKEMEHSAASTLETCQKDVQEIKELKELLHEKSEHLAVSEASLKKVLEDVQRKPKGGPGDEEEAKEAKDELLLAEQEVKRSRSRIQSLEKQVQQAHKETNLLKRELERTGLPHMKQSDAEKEVKRCRAVIEKLAKTSYQAREEIALLKQELETRKRGRDPNADSTDAELAEGGDSPGPKKPRADEV
jgi:hypothetical protein